MNLLFLKLKFDEKLGRKLHLRKSSLEPGASHKRDAITTPPPYIPRRDMRINESTRYIDF